MHQNAEERIANQVSGMDNISLQGKYNSLGFVSAPFVFKYVADRITIHKNTQEKVPSGQVTSIFLVIRSSHHSQAFLVRRDLVIPHKNTQEKVPSTILVERSK